MKKGEHTSCTPGKNLAHMNNVVRGRPRWKESWSFEAHDGMVRHSAGSSLSVEAPFTELA